MTGLRERKKADTRRALSDAALHLAFERGLENITREDVADLAGVSPRTFNNYFSGKYEALAYRQAERVRRSIDILRECPADEPLWTSVTHAVLTPLEEDFGDMRGDANRPPERHQLVEIRKLLMHPQVRNSVPHHLFDELLQLIAERTGTDPGDLYPRLVMSVVRAVGDAAADAYARADPPVPITALIREGFAAVSEGLPVPDRKKTP
ncbi:MAG TPA: TetR/AcrR family transcriptional regulator [Mycobacterium sp.]|jgi:AcrR family transcriptional regulator